MRKFRVFICAPWTLLLAYIAAVLISGIVATLLAR